MDTPLLSPFLNTHKRIIQKFVAQVLVCDGTNNKLIEKQNAQTAVAVVIFSKSWRVHARYPMMHTKMYNYSYSIYKTTKPEIFCLFWTVFLKKTIFVFILSIFCCVFLFYILKQKRDELFALKPFWWRKYVLQSFFIFSSIARLLIQKKNKMICCTIKKTTYAGRWMILNQNGKFMKKIEI